MMQARSQTTKPARPLGQRLKRSALGIASFAARSVGHSADVARFLAAEMLQEWIRPFERGRKP
jgi:hypothetical protein